MKIDRCAFGSWTSCVRLSNGAVELIATLDVEPRVIRFGFIGGENAFKEYVAQLGQTGDNEWRIDGRHWLWHARLQQYRTWYGTRPRSTMAKLCRRAENQWVGVNCGIMDQMISGCGRVSHALLIDCRSLETESVPLPRDTVVVVLDTGTRRGLVDSAYNERRAQCEAAASFFGVGALRDVSVAEFAKRVGGLDELMRRRAHRAITENERTLAAAKTSDSVVLGKLMDASHANLREDFEVTNSELNMSPWFGTAQSADLWRL